MVLVRDMEHWGFFLLIWSVFRLSLLIESFSSNWMTAFVQNSTLLESDYVKRVRGPVPRVSTPMHSGGSSLAKAGSLLFGGYLNMKIHF